MLLKVVQILSRISRLPRGQVLAEHVSNFWHSLSREIGHLSKNNFKIKVHNVLFQRLSEENDCINLCLNNENMLILWLLIFVLCIDLILDDTHLADSYFVQNLFVYRFVSQ